MKNKPYIVGITGHRYLKESCISHYQNKVFELLQELQKKHKDIVVYSPLADGADRLVINEAEKLNIPYIAILPMPKESYMMDFNETSKKDFDSLLNSASEVITLPLCNGSTLQDIATYSKKRDAQYEAVGYYIANSVNALIALWDGKQIELRGGTGEIVDYYLKKQHSMLYHLLVSRSNDVGNVMVEFKEHNS